MYQELCKKHTTFRERSENVDVAVEVSLQPWRAFKPDGVILFSDILTPLPGLNIPFDITAGQGPIIADPIRCMEQVNKVTPLDAEAAVPFVGETLRALKQEVRLVDVLPAGFEAFLVVSRYRVVVQFLQRYISFTFL